MLCRSLNKYSTVFLSPVRTAATVTRSVSRAVAMVLPPAVALAWRVPILCGRLTQYPECRIICQCTGFDQIGFLTSIPIVPGYRCEIGHTRTTCAACSWPVHWPSSATPRSTAPSIGPGSRRCWRGARRRSPHRAGQQDCADGLGHDGQGRALQATRRTCGVLPAFSFQGSDSLPAMILAKQRPKFPTALREPLAKPFLKQDP